MAEYISALANSAAIEDQSYGFVIWGVDDSGTVVGTTVDPWSTKVGKEDLLAWLRRKIWPEHRLNLEEFARHINTPTGSDPANRLELPGRHQFVVADGNSKWSITNLGACTIARRIHDFPSLARKAPRRTRRLHRA